MKNSNFLLLTTAYQTPPLHCTKHGRQNSYDPVPTDHHATGHSPGQLVIAQPAVILESRANGQSYVIKINGRTYLQNRRFLRPSLEPDQANPMRPPAPQEAASTRPPTPQEATAKPEVRKEPKEPKAPQRTYPT